MNKKFKEAGNTVIEILIATVIVGLILTSLALSLTNSIQNSAEAQYRETGSRLAQDAMEVFRKDKNVLSWSTFSAEPVDSGTFCLPTSFSSVTSGSFPGVTLATISTCSYVALNNINYYRAVTKTPIYTGTPPVITSVKVIVYTYWNVNIPGKERSTSVEQTFFKVK